MRAMRHVVALCSFAVAFAFATTPALADPVKCKATITKAAAQYVQARTKALVKCEGAVVAGKLPPATVCTTQAAAAITKAKGKMEGAIDKACGGADKNCGGGDDDSLSSIGWAIGTCPDLESLGCTNAIANCGDVSTCLECVQDAAVDQAVALYYDGLVPGTTADKPLNKCQQAIGKASAAFLAAKSKALSKCWGAVNKGTISGPCPAPGDGKAAAAIAAAEAKKVAAICKACGGGDKGCDLPITTPSATFPGTGGSDDQTTAAIGFPGNCADLAIPGGASCAQPIATLADIVECVDCITEFKVDCADRLAVPWAGALPGECNPGCGNNLVETGETCDGTDDSACPGGCAPTFLPEACTCPTGTFALDGVAGADLDTGWTGIAHQQGALVGHLFDADTYGCTGAGPDTNCNFVARYATPFFGAPLPLSSGGVPICVVNELAAPTTGTIDVATGDLVFDYSLTSHVFSGIDTAKPCPACVGDVTVDDDVKNGTCDGGDNDGGACDVDGLSASFGGTSFDCLPNLGSAISDLAIKFDDATTGSQTRTTSATSPPCTAVVGPKCFCDTCDHAGVLACASNADCPMNGVNPGICGGRRCLGGVNAGAPCSNATECPGSACQRPGTATNVNACVDDAMVVGDGTLCSDIGNDEGECPEGPVDNNCAAPEQFRSCIDGSECPVTGVCVTANRRCFLPSVTRTGIPGTTSGAYAGEFCIPPTGAVAVNNVAGLPGLGTLVLPYTININVP